MHTIALIIFAAVIQTATIGHKPSTPSYKAVSAQACDSSKGFRPLVQGTGCVRSF